MVKQKWKNEMCAVHMSKARRGHDVQKILYCYYNCYIDFPLSLCSVRVRPASREILSKCELKYMFSGAFELRENQRGLNSPALAINNLFYYHVSEYKIDHNIVKKHEK